MFNEKDKKAINMQTFGPSYTNPDTKERMQVDYSNKLLSIKIMPMSEDFKGDESAGGKLVISASTASLFLDELEEARDAFKNGEPFSSMIPCGIQSNNAIQICDGRCISRPYGMYIVMYMDIQQNKKTNNIFVYTLKSSFTIKDYDAKTGAGTNVAKPHREIKDIITNFKEFVKASNRAMAHSVKDADKFRTSQLSNAAKVANKNGTSVYGNNGNSNGNWNKNNSSIFENSDDIGSYEYSSELSSVLTGNFEQYS